MVIVEKAGACHFGALGFQRRDEFLGPPDAGKGEDALSSQRAGIGLQPRPQDRAGITAKIGIAITHQNDRIGAGQSLSYGLPQRTCRDHPAIAEAGLRIHHHQRQRFLQREILMAVIHHQRVGIFLRRQLGPRGAVLGHHCWGCAHQQQGLVAHHRRTVGARHQCWALFAAAIATRQEERLAAARAQGGCKGNGDGRLAAAARRQVAYADHGQAGVGRPGETRLQRNAGAIQKAQRRQQRRQRPATLPEIRCAHRAALSGR